MADADGFALTVGDSGDVLVVPDDLVADPDTKVASLDGCSEETTFLCLSFSCEWESDGASSMAIFLCSCNSFFASESLVSFLTGNEWLVMTLTVTIIVVTTAHTVLNLVIFVYVKHLSLKFEVMLLNIQESFLALLLIAVHMNVRITNAFSL